jgi:hypothetical protein
LLGGRKLFEWFKQPCRFYSHCIVDSYGFRLFDLEKVFEIKSNDNKRTLLMFVIEEIKRQKNLDVIDTSDKLEDFEFLQRINTVGLVQEIADIKK